MIKVLNSYSVGDSKVIVASVNGKLINTTLESLQQQARNYLQNRSILQAEQLLNRTSP